MSIFDGMSRPARAAGVALLGVAVVAAVIGTTTVLTGGDSTDVAASDSSSAQQGPGPSDGRPGDGNSPDKGKPGEQPPQQGEPDKPGAPGGPDQSAPPQHPGGGQPPTGADGTPPADQAPGADGQAGDVPAGESGNAQAAPGDGQQAAAKWVTVRVYNNSTIKGLGEKAAENFRKQGWNVAEHGNYPSGRIPTTTVYYRPGTDEQMAAQALASSNGMRAEQRFEGIANSSEGVIVIVTNDYKDAGNAG